MGVTKTIIREGQGEQPAPNDVVTIEYTGWLKDASKPDKKGKQYAHHATGQWAAPRRGGGGGVGERALHG